MSFSLVGTYTFTPDDTQVIVGGFSLGENHDTLWVRITQDQPPGPWPWSYGILGWRSSFGYELGTTKAFAEPQGSVQRLGLGLPPVERAGVLTFEPRSFNLAWIKQGNPWTLTFEAQSGVSSQSGGVELSGGTSVVFGVSDGSVGYPWVLSPQGFANLSA